MPAYRLPSDHCESCGAPSPILIDGYTECCNEPVCHGALQTWALMERVGEYGAKLTGEMVEGCCHGAIRAGNGPTLTCLAG